MTTVTTKLIKDGNSTAVRLPKLVLEMSGLHGEIRMEVHRGKVILRSSRAPRAGWRKHIARTLAANPKAVAADPELDVWELTNDDGLDKLR